MPDRVLRVVLTGSAEGAVRAMAETDAAADEAAHSIGDHFEKGTSRISGAFSKLGNSMQNWGIPFGKTVSNMGEHLDAAGSKASKFGAVLSDVGKVSLGILGAGTVAVGAESIHMATNFQTAMTQLVTGAGEAQKNIGLVSSGILNMAASVGKTPQELASGMYMIESAGFHGANGLKVLKAAAEGAAVGGAQMSDVANVVTSALNAYGLSGSHATSVTNQLVATVAAGKMHMQDLALAMGNVLPIANAAHISLAQVGGALATMTSQGLTARRASMNLTNMIRSLISPTATASAEMQKFGLNANVISTSMGKVGLTGTLDTLTESILKNTKGGYALATGFDTMSPAAKRVSQEILAGTITTKGLQTAMYGLSPIQAKLVSNFDAQATSATGLKQTFAGAMKTMVGGATGLNVALLLSGEHAKTFADNVKSIGAAGDEAGSKVRGFGKVQHDLAFQMEQVKSGVEALGIKFGMFLLPIVERGIRDLGDLVSWMQKNKIVAEVLGGIVGGFLSVAIGAFVVNKLSKMVTGFREAAATVQKFYGIITRNQGVIDSAAQKLGNLTNKTNANKTATEESGATQQATGEKTATAGTEAETAGIKQEGLATSEKLAGTSAATAAVEQTTLAEKEGLAGDAASADAVEQDALAGSERMAGTAAATAGAEEAAGAAEAEGGAAVGAGEEGAAGLGLAGMGAAGLGVGAGIAGYAALVGLGERGQHAKRPTGWGGSFKGLATHARALGGDVHGGESYVVGEHGPEILHLGGQGNRGRVDPHAEAVKQMGGGTTGSTTSGGRPISVNVTAQTNASGAQIAREVEWALRHAS